MSGAKGNGERRGGMSPEMGIIDKYARDGKEVEKGKDATLDWGVKRVLFSTSRTVFLTLMLLIVIFVTCHFCALVH